MGAYQGYPAAVGPALEVELYGMTKRFGAVTALDNVSVGLWPARSTRSSERTGPARARW